MMRKVACYIVLMLAFVGTMRAEGVGQEWAVPVRTSALVAIEGLENDTTQREQIGLFWQENRLCVQRYNAPNAVLATAQVAGDTLFLMEHQLYAVNKVANFAYSVDLAPRDFMAVKLNGESVFPVMNWDSARVYPTKPLLEQPMDDYFVGRWTKVVKPRIVERKENTKTLSPERVRYNKADYYDTTYVLLINYDFTWSYYEYDTLKDCGVFDVKPVTRPVYICWDCNRNNFYTQDTALLRGHMHTDWDWYYTDINGQFAVEGEYYACRKTANPEHLIECMVNLQSTTNELGVTDRTLLFFMLRMKTFVEERKECATLGSSSLWQTEFLQGGATLWE